MTAAPFKATPQTARRLRRLMLLSAMTLPLAGTVTAGTPIPPSDAVRDVQSSDGLLSVTLQATEGRVAVGDLELPGMTYNGVYAGPILRARPGDLLRIRLINRISQPTNLHFHGLRSSPLGNSDNAHVAVAPGEAFLYEVRIPASQPPGLYWYHSHVHGESERQVMGGLSGALLVQQPVAAGLQERLFVLKDMTFDDDTGDPKVDDELHGIVQSINGSLDIGETMRPGETQLWRFSNQSANRVFHIALRGHRFRIIAEDGEANVVQRSVDVLDINPSSRVEVLVEAGAPGRFDLLSTGAMTGTGADRSPDRVLGHVVVAGPQASPPAAMPPVSGPPDLRQASIAERRDVVFTQARRGKSSELTYYINGNVFDPERVDIRVPLGNVEEWTVRNDSDDMHIFHIHQLGFQVVEINGVPAPFTGHVDTVRVPERGEVRIRMAFTDRLILGRFMFHCHVLNHEDRGMMAQIEVYDPLPMGIVQRLDRLRFHVWWWLHGVPWSLCGLADV